MRKEYRRYDHRLRNMIARSGSIDGYLGLDIPKSTLKSWIKSGPKEYITIDQFEQTSEEIIKENIALKKSLEEELAKNNLIFKTIRIFGFQIQYKRLPKPESKKSILNVVAEATKNLSLKTCLDIIGLSSARYFSWVKRSIKCSLEDQPSCPRSSVQRHTAFEINTIKSMYLDKRYLHYSISSLALKAKAIKEVFASSSTWSRVIRQYKLNRSKKRIYPARPRVGIRAERVGQIWHLDQSIIR